jgi:hypothetical protein
MPRFVQFLIDMYVNELTVKVVECAGRWHASGTNCSPMGASDIKLTKEFQGPPIAQGRTNTGLSLVGSFVSLRTAFRDKYDNLVTNLV